MIGHLKGEILEKNKGKIILSASGVGYLVFAPNEIFEKFEIGETVSLYIHTAVREDNISLFGFESKEKLDFFELLLTVTRIGPKSALDIMNVPVQKVKMAISKKDIAFLSSTPGIGRKTAERIIVELKDKIGIVSEGEYFEEINVPQDVIDAIEKLGYQQREINRILRNMPSHIKDEESIIKYFLQNV